MFRKLTAAFLLAATASGAFAQESPADGAPTDPPWFLCAKTKPPRHYPVEADRRDIASGNTRVRCNVVWATGKPAACTWDYESPAGYGFGEYAAKRACSFGFKAEKRSGLTFFVVPMVVTPGR